MAWLMMNTLGEVRVSAVPNGRPLSSRVPTVSK